MSLFEFSDTRFSPFLLEGETRVVVSGGRTYAKHRFIWNVLDLFSPDFVAEGGAAGADDAALSWRKMNGVAGQTYEADWKRYGLGAGGMRNSFMLDNARPNLVLAFGGWKGTPDCVKKARKRGIQVIWFDEPKDKIPERDLERMRQCF